MSRIKSIIALLLVCLIWVLISGYGIHALIKRQLLDYMFRKTVFAFFDYSEPRIFFFLDYLAIMLLFGLIGYLLVRVTANKNENRRIQ